MNCSSNLLLLIVILTVWVTYIESCCTSECNSCESSSCSSCRTNSCRSNCETSSCSNSCCSKCVETCGSTNRNCISNCRRTCSSTGTVQTGQPVQPAESKQEETQSSNTATKNDVKLDERATADAQNQITLKSDVNSTFQIQNTLQNQNEIKIPINVTNQNLNNIHISLDTQQQGGSVQPGKPCTTCTPQDREIIYVTQQPEIQIKEVFRTVQVPQPYPVQVPQPYPVYIRTGGSGCCNVNCAVNPTSQCCQQVNPCANVNCATNWNSACCTGVRINPCTNVNCATNWNSACCASGGYRGYYYTGASAGCSSWCNVMGSSGSSMCSGCQQTLPIQGK